MELISQLGQRSFIVLILATSALTAPPVNKPWYSLCEATNECATGYCCLLPIWGGASTCQPLAVLGAQCSIRAYSGKYKYFCPCIDGARCDTSMYMCVPPAADGYNFIMSLKSKLK